MLFHQAQSSSASRFTAGAAGFLNLASRAIGLNGSVSDILPRNTVQVQHDSRLVGQQRSLYPPPQSAQAQRRHRRQSRHRSDIAVHELPLMAATNKCLARSNKSRTFSTEHTNGDPADKGNRAPQREA